VTNDMTAELAGLMRAALDSATLPPPPELRMSMLDEARRRRSSGQWCGVVESICPMDAFRLATDRLERLLGDRLESEWVLPARRGWTVKDLVAHLVGADNHLGAVLGLWPHALPETATHVEVTAPAIAEFACATPETVVRRWRQGVDALVARAPEIEARRDQVVDFYGARLRIDDVLTVRSFEVWAHSEDIAAAVDCAIEPPEPARLALMTDLAIRLLPFGLHLTQRHLPTATARLVLTGAGGGTWDVPMVESCAPAAPDVVVILDVVEFCRHAAHGHLHAERLDAVEGDRSLVPVLLAGAAAFAE
jgi:uncharacterized protein (TIGR03083 family)